MTDAFFGFAARFSHLMLWAASCRAPSPTAQQYPEYRGCWNDQVAETAVVAGGVLFHSVRSAVGAVGSHDEVKKVAGEDDKEGDGAKEDAAEPPGHDVAEHGGFRQGEPDGGHHEGQGRAQWDAFGNEDVDDGDDGGSIGIHGDGAENGSGDAPPVLRAHGGLEKAGGDIAVDAGTDGDADEDVEHNAADDVLCFPGDNR